MEKRLVRKDISLVGRFNYFLTHCVQNSCETDLSNIWWGYCSMGKLQLHWNQTNPSQWKPPEDLRKYCWDVVKDVRKLISNKKITEPRFYEKNQKVRLAFVPVLPPTLFFSWKGLWNRQRWAEPLPAAQSGHRSQNSGQPSREAVLLNWVRTSEGVNQGIRRDQKKTDPRRQTAVKVWAMLVPLRDKVTPAF